MDAKQFLQELHGSKKAEFRALKKGSDSKSVSGNFEDCERRLRGLNESGYNIYFTVNSGGTKKNQINQINAAFIDFDCGRDDDKNYYPLDVVGDYKDEKIDELAEFELPPSAVVETRNGLHAYWFLDEGCSIAKFEECQLRLIDYFESDPSVKTPERIMRMPDFNWVKDADNPFMCRVLDSTGTRYGVGELLGILPMVERTCRVSEGQEKSVLDNKCIKDINYQGQKTLVSLGASNLIHIQAGDVDELRRLIEPVPFLAQSEQALYDYVTRQIDLREFLGLPEYGNFQCIFHDDRNPSASIMVDRKSGFQFYTCFSSTCKVETINIIHCVEKLRMCKRHEAIEFIKDVYLIELEKTEWQLEQISILQNNRRMLINGEIKHTHPEVYQIIARYLPQLVVMHDIAIDNIRDDTKVDSQGNSVFFCSRKQIAKALGYSDGRRVTERITLLSFMQFLNKLKREEIPSDDLKTAIHSCIKNGHSKLVNFYSIPEYDYLLLDSAVQRANIYREHNMRIGTMNLEGIKRTLGDEVAYELFPQYKFEIDRGTSESSDIRTEDIAKVIFHLLHTEGYAQEKRVIEVLKQHHGKYAVESQLKKSLQEILEAYDLKRVRANNEIKKMYGVVSRGYPFIIVRNTEDASDGELPTSIYENNVNEQSNVEAVFFMPKNGGDKDEK